jgi:two-component system, chemotaxis family, sensor kinase Cph1
MKPILVVDDDSCNRYILIKYLSYAGLEAIEAENGMEAVELFKEYRPSLILMDIEMPIMNGKEATRKIKELAPEKTVIGISSLPREADISPFDAYIEKPYEFWQIEEALTKFGVYDGSLR